MVALSGGFLARFSCQLLGSARVSPEPLQGAREAGVLLDSCQQCASLLFIRKGA